MSQNTVPESEIVPVDPADVSLRHRAEYLAFRVVKGVLLVLPERLAEAIGAGLGWFAGAVLRVRRGVVDENLALAFPDATPEWRDRVAVDSYRHLVREAVATFRLEQLTPEDVRRRTTGHGDFQEMVAAAEAGSAIIVTGHFGNWEFGGAAAAVHGVPVDAVALVQANLLFDRHVVRTRQRLGVRVLPRGSASRLVLRSLRDGRTPALVADQNVRNGGVFVDFFGVPASTARGPALFALRSGAPVFVGLAVRRAAPAVGYDIHVERIDAERTGNLDEDVRLLTQAHTAILERWVRRHPEQYFWQHKRWKTRPPGTDLPPRQ